MQLRRIYLRYFPPGLRLEYALSSGAVERKTVDLLHVSAESNIQHVVAQLLAREKLLTKAVAPKLSELLHRLVEKQLSLVSAREDSFQLHSVHRAHALPMTNFTCSKHARVVATCSYDKTIKVFRPFEKKLVADDKTTLSGHEGVVFCVAFNKPHANLLLSGSFDKTCRIWDVDKKTCKGVFKGAP
jgi:dynein assembly factor with WDR repeat domains 1|uniref:Uncharacterized protein n=1 Tax=Globisporangium ultimum (strain ATCC 200006 / CBS 805.95 / DAOM BR144) TaxID=431595 RepID=K3WPY0_GLOUD